MGIPHLISQLRPFAKPFTRSKVDWEEGGEKSASGRNSLIVDGPSLAYFIYHRCLASHGDARHALEAIPSYDELGQAVIQWLQTIEEFGHEVRYIFFDGYLPDSKIDTRRERLQSYLNQSRAFRNVYPNLGETNAANLNPKSESKGSTKTNATTLFNTQYASKRLAALPGAPFLVPAIMQALFVSKYRNRARVVPNEADVLCAMKGSRKTDIILTNDSDLFLYGTEAAVVFFNDLEFKSTESSCDMLQGLSYHSREIAERMSCPDLLKLAFYMKNNPNSSLKKCAALAKENRLTMEDQNSWKRFQDGYLAEERVSPLDALDSSGTLATVLEHLDPRISEFVHDWAKGLGPKEVDLGASETIVRRMYLPFLIDDTTRASAWRVSIGVRRLAYSILALCGLRVGMGEVDRRGERIMETQVPLYTVEEVARACEALETSLGQVELLEPSTWRRIALMSVMNSLAEGGTMPPRGVVLQLAREPSRLSWPLVHLKAQVQAYLYSCRMLRQILDVYYAAFEDGNDARQQALRETLDKGALDSLRLKLNAMPPLCELFMASGGGIPIDHGTEKLHEDLCHLYDPSRETQSPPHNRHQAKRERKRRRSARSGSRPNTNAPVNMYSLLDEA